MGLLKFGLCVVISISCVSKICGDSSRNLLHTELECSEEDGVLESGPCIQCICVQQKIVCEKVVCGLEDDDDSDSVAGTESIAMNQKVRPPEIIVKIPNRAIANTIYKQPIRETLQKDDYPEQVVAVSITASDDNSEEDGLSIPIGIQTHIPLDYKKENNILDDLLADNTPNDSKALTETRVDDILKTLTTFSNDNRNEKYVLIVPEDFQSDDDAYDKIPHEVTWLDILNNNLKTHQSRHDKVGIEPLVFVNKNKKDTLSPIRAIDGYNTIPFARQPYVFARPGDKRLFMRPRHYMRNDDSLYSNEFKSIYYPWFNHKPVDYVPAKGPDADYWYDYVQKHPDADLYAQYESVGQKWPFTKEKFKGDFKTSKKLKYPWLNEKLSSIYGQADPSDRIYYKFLQQYGNDADLSSYYVQKTPNSNFHNTDQSYNNMYNNFVSDGHVHYNSNANADRYDRFSNAYNKNEKAENDQNLVLNDKINFNISDVQQFIRPSTLGNNQATYQELNSSYPKTFEVMNQIPIYYQLQGQNVNEYPGVFDQNKYGNNFIPISNNQPSMGDEYANKNQTAINDQLKWQNANGYSEILSNEQPEQDLEFDESDLFGNGKNQQIFNFLQQKNYSSYDSKNISDHFSKISQSLPNRPLVSMSAITPGQTQSGSYINNSNEQMLLPYKFQLGQHDNGFFGGLSSKHPDNYQYNYKLPAKNIIQTFGNKKQVNYFSNDSQYTSNNFSKILFGQPNTPIISISEILPSDIQDEKPGDANFITNENNGELVKKIKWLQDQYYLFNDKHHKPLLQSSSSIYELKPGKLDYLSTNSGYLDKHPKLSPDQFQWKYGNKYPSTQDYKDGEPVHDYDEYGILASINDQMFGNKPKVKDSKYLTLNWPFISQPNSDDFKLIKSKFDQDKNRQPCGSDENCGYKSWPSGKKIRPIPLSFLLGDSTDSQIPSNEQDNAIKYEDSDDNLFITVPITNGGIPDFENHDIVLFNPNDSNYIVLSHPKIENNSQTLDNEQTKHKEPWDFTYEDKNNANRFPELSFTTPPSTLFTGVNNIPAPYYNIPENKKYEFSQLNSVVPKEFVLFPYVSKSKKHKHNYYPKSHKNFVNQIPKYPHKNIPFNLQDVISDKCYKTMPSKNNPNLDKLLVPDKNITPKLTENVLNYGAFPNKISNYVSDIPEQYKYYQQNFLPVLQYTIPRPNHNTIASLPYANQLIYNREPVILGSSKNMNPLKLFIKPNYYPLQPKGLLSNKNVHIILPNNMQILPKVFPKQVNSAQTPQFYLQNGIPKFPEENLFSNLYGYYYPRLSSFPQVTRNKPEPTAVGDIYKLLKKMPNNKPLKLFLKKKLNDESRMSENQPKILPKFKAKNNVGSNTLNYELPSYNRKEDYPVYSDTSDNGHLERYVKKLLPNLIPPDQTKYKNILTSDDRILPKYKKTNNVGCVVCETFNKNIHLLAKYLNNNHQQNDIMYLVLKDIIKPLVQFVHKLISENSKLPLKITSAKPKPLLLHSKDEKISVSPKFRLLNNKKKKNRYYSNNSKRLLFDLNSLSYVFFQNDSQTLPEKKSIKPKLYQNASPPKTNNVYSKPDKSQHLTLYNKHNKKPLKVKKQHVIAREDESVDSVPDLNIENPQSYHRESHMVKEDENNIPKRSIGKIPQNENRVSFEDYLDIPIEEQDIEYSAYHWPILHKISSFESDPNRKIYLYKNPNAKFVEGPYVPKKGVNIKLYDKLHDSDKDPVLTDELNLIPMGVPRPKENSDEDNEVQNDDYNTKSRESVDRIRIALHNPYKYDNIEPVYNTKIIHNHEEKPAVDHHIVVPTIYPEQVCSMFKTLNCGRHMPNHEQNNIPFQNNNNPYVDSIILNPHIISDTKSNVVLEILKRLNQVNIEANYYKELNLRVMVNLILEKLKSCIDNFNFETIDNSKLIPNYEGSEVIPLRTMLSKYKTLFQDLGAMVIKKFKIQQSEEKPKESIWSKPETLFDIASYLPQYFNLFKPLLLRKIVTPSSVKRPLSNHIVNHLKNSKGNKIHNFMPIESEESNIYGRHIKTKTNKKLNFNNIYKLIKHAWEVYLSSDEDQLDYAKFFKPKVKDYHYTKPTKHKDGTDLLLESDQFPLWHETAYSDRKPIRGTNKSNQFIIKDHTKKQFNNVNAYEEQNKYPKPVINKQSWQKYNDVPYDLDKLPFAKFWEQNAKHNINANTDDFLNNKFKNQEPSNKWQIPKKSQFPFPKHNFKPRGKETENVDTKVCNDSGRPFKGHKYPAIESLKHVWKLSNALFDQGPSTSPKFLKPRGIKQEPNNISSNNHDLKPSLDDELYHLWQKINVFSDKDLYSFSNNLMPKEIQYPEHAIKNKINPEIVLSKIRPFNHKYRDPMKYSWQKTIKPSGLNQIPFPKYLKPKEVTYPDQTDKYKHKNEDEYPFNYSFENHEYAAAKPAKLDWEKPDILPDLSQVSLAENFNPTTKIKYPDIKQMSTEFFNKDPFEHHEQLNMQPKKHVWEKLDGSPDLNLEKPKLSEFLNGKEIKYTTSEPIKYTDLLDGISNYAPFKSHEEIDLKPSEHIIQSSDTSFAKGQLPFAKYLKPQDSVNEHSNEEAIKGKETTDKLFHQDHVIHQDSNYSNYFKGRKLADLESEDNSRENPDISPDHDNLYQSKNSEGIDWTAPDSNENFWQKSDVANNNDDLEHSEPTESEMNFSSTNNPDDPNSDIAAILDYINQKQEPTEKDQKDNKEPILVIDTKGQNARWADVTDFNIQRVNPNAVKYEYAEAPLIEDDSDLT